MAEIKSFPNNQDEYIGAENVMKWLHGRTSGVFGAAGNCSVSAVPGSMAVTVSDGNGWMANNAADGVVWWVDNEKVDGSKLTLTVDVADGVLNRIDRVVVSWETTNYVARPTITILKGATASRPVAPALTNNSTMRQISLARIYIAAGTLSLSPSMITDERLNPEVCGIVTDTVEVDTGVINAQVEELIQKFENELENIKSDYPFVLKTGDAMNGPLSVLDPSDDAHAVNRRYMNSALIAPNLLDNWNFLNPINQRGISGAVTSSGYFIDRWMLDSGSVELTNNGLVLNGTISQILEFPVGENITATFLTDTGIRDAAYSDDTRTFTITASGETILAAKLETGFTQTLARQFEDGIWILAEIPNYEQQLARCQRYCTVIKNNGGIASLVGFGSAYGTTNFMGIIPLPVPMRTNPGLTFVGTMRLRGYGSDKDFSNDGHAISCFNVSANGVSVSIAGLTDLANCQVYNILMLNGAKLVITADL